MNSPRASFAFPETGIGIYPGLGGTQRTTRRIGRGLAKWLVLTGETIQADEALAIGLVDRVVPINGADALRLSRMTEWRELGPSTYAGIGQRMWATDAGEFALLDTREIVFNVGVP